MKVLAFSFDHISAEKKKEIDKETSMNTDMNIIDIRKHNSDMFKGQELLTIDYKFTIDYSKDYASVFFKGKITLLMEKSEKELINSILKEWESKKIFEDFNIPLFQIIFSKCSLKALQLEDYLNIPTHLPLIPKVKKA